ncbi:MAG: response regulator [Acidobacteriia bacterium]|jgi:CheY-like chemotaxis protein|nr:response regulator [Terriglobia bacterium]
MSDLKRILIVEDHALVAKFYCMALERAGGFTCWVCEDVEAILAAVAEGRVDLVLLDVSLSGTHRQGRPVDGIELARLIQQAAKANGRTLPILLATAHAMAGDRERLLAASGADDYLEKPVYDAELLVRKIRRLLGAGETA